MRPGRCGSASSCCSPGRPSILARLTSRYYGAKAGFLAAFALNVTGYYGLAASMFALPDGPLLFFWLLTLDRLSVALDEPEPAACGPGSGSGLAWGGAMLSKYHAVFIPMGAAVYLLLDRRNAALAAPPGPYLALAIGLVGVQPGPDLECRAWLGVVPLPGGPRGRAAGCRGPITSVVAILAQAGYLFPWIWIPLVILLVRGWRRWPGLADGPERLWLCLAAVPLAVFTAVACFRPVLPHWGLIGLVSMFPILGRAWAERLETRPAAGSPAARGLCRPVPDPDRR